jgi:hypothetical protein
MDIYAIGTVLNSMKPLIYETNRSRLVYWSYDGRSVAQTLTGAHTNTGGHWFNSASF